MDPSAFFPAEIFEKILYYVCSDDISNVSLVSKHWLTFLDEDNILWKKLCEGIVEQDDLKIDVSLKMKWKDIFKKNHGKHGVIRRWKEGRYDKISSYEDLTKAKGFICKLDVTTWGYLLDIATSTASDYQAN